MNPSLDYIKRVVGVPGDRIEYRNKQLTVNGTPVPLRQVDDYLSEGAHAVLAPLHRDR